jgi:hypothetical protein
MLSWICIVLYADEPDFVWVDWHALCHERNPTLTGPDVRKHQSRVILEVSAADALLSSWLDAPASRRVSNLW